MLELRGVQAGYGRIQALREVTLTVGGGEIVTLIGANGAGKSTTLMAVCGIVPAQAGEILFEGESLHGLSPEAIVRRGIVQVPEGRRIFPRLSVLENLELGAFLRRDAAGIRRDLDHVMELFPILADRRRQPGGTLSGGEQQMLAISRALMARPRLLLLDEPSLGLAPLVIRQIFAIIRRINAEGTTVFLVEQNANQALKLAHRGYVLENGRTVLADTAERLLDNEDVKRAYLGI
ncbi:MAG: ABC transporter ATP-binding protein [Deltaproteobacteria bacterium]|nr:MAG: ABC transporter ATP-binding protein [Deltaproteobacteria bacterium]